MFAAAVAPAIPPRSFLSVFFISLRTAPTERSTYRLFAASVPRTGSATLVIRRSLPTEPTETVFASFATEPWPSATELAAVAFAP